MLKKHIDTKDITKISIMAALIFALTYLIKIPSLNGYTHLGDSMIFIAAILLGKKNGALAAGLGAALSDLLSGYMQYILPTFIIKAIMVLIICTIAKNLFTKTKFNWIIGIVIGSIFQIAGYFIVETVLYGVTAASLSIVGNIIQSIVGLFIATIFIGILQKSNVFNLKN